MDLALLGSAIVVSAIVLFWPTTPGPPLFPYADKIVHVLIFVALAWTGSRVGIWLPVLVAGLVAYAVGSEVIQYAVLPDRGGGWSDALADLVGAAIGLLVARHRAIRG